MKPNEMMNGYALGLREGAIEEARQSEKSLEPLMWLLLAVNEGRVVVLPCKVGDVVYRVCKQKYPVDSYRMHWEEDWVILTRPFDLSMIPEIGKTIFLTREEAEQSLKGAQHEE